MNSDQLQECSSTELRDAQERIEKILNNRKQNSGVAKHDSQNPKRDSTVPRRSSKMSLSNDKPFLLRRSSSLIEMRHNDLATASNQSLTFPRPNTSDNKRQYFGEVAFESFGESDDDAVTFPLMSTTTHSKQTRKNYRQLANAAMRLNTILTDVQTSAFTCYKCCGSKCGHVKHMKKKGISVPSLEEKHCISKLINVIDTVSDQLQRDINCFLSLSVEDKNSLEDALRSKAALKQRLTKALTVQRNLEEEVIDLGRRNEVLELENRSLSIKVTPLNLDNREREARAHHRREVTPRRKGDYSLHASNNNNFNAGEEDDAKGVSERDSDSFAVAANDVDFTEIVESIAHDQDHHEACHQELDSITSYVKWKSMDFGRLHEKLTRSFEETEKQRQALSSLVQEKEEMLADVEDLVESYRELQKERDSYESILKMILKERNSSHSTLNELLDGLLVQLTHSPKTFNDNGSGTRADHYNRLSSKTFLESALHVIQEQNISLREELGKLKESLQKTSGQNILLQSNNTELTDRVQEMQRQIETKEQEAEERERDTKEKYEKLDQLYKLVSSAKDGLDAILQEKEKEILKLRNLEEDCANKTVCQAKKIVELKNENNKLEKEVSDFKSNIDKSNRMLKQLKENLKEEKGKWAERVRITSDELETSKDHCKWLQTQIDNLNSQLLDAHERIKLHEKDKSILAQRVLAADEERKTLDRKILEIKSIMHGDTIYREALAERNEVLQSEINRLRKQSMLHEYSSKQDEEETFPLHLKKSLEKLGIGSSDKKEGKTVGGDPLSSTPDEMSSLASSTPGEKSLAKQFGRRDITPLSRKSRLPQRHNHLHHYSSTNKYGTETAPRAAVSLHNPTVLCYRTKFTD